MYEIAPETADDQPAIERLLDEVFGKQRRAKASYAYRAGVEPVSGLGFVARLGERLVGTIRFWPVRIGDRDTPALLLGPLGVARTWQGNGVGGRLIERGLATAAAAGHRLVVLVGDLDYYARFGFQGAAAHGIAMPGERPHRLLLKELAPGALAAAAGDLRPWRNPRRP
jgi:predicted N-acetyltransferase YhbS